MKQIVRSKLGKCLLFIFCVIFACTAMGSSLAAAVMLKEKDIFYSSSEEEMLHKLEERELFSLATDCVWTATSEHPFNGIDDYTFEVSDSTGKVIYCAGEAAAITEWPYTYTCGVQRNVWGDIVSVYVLSSGRSENEDTYTVHLASSALTGGEQSPQRTALHIAYVLRYKVFEIAVSALLAALFCFVALMFGAGRRSGSDELFPGVLCRVPYDVLFVCTCTVEIAGAALILEFINGNEYTMVFGLLLLPLLAALGLWFCMNTAVQIKARTLWSRSLICRLGKKALKLLKSFALQVWALVRRAVRAVGELLHDLPLVWKTALGICSLSLAEFFILALFHRDTDVILFLFVAEKLVLIPAVLYVALCLRKLQEGGHALAAGDLKYVTDTTHLFGDLKGHGQDLNSIAAGMNAAVEQKLKSERMKTELITNVSHDIKTPLTSIINYSSLIGEEPCENEKVHEYAEVLVRQSKRLKRLLEDLVEASRASTGNLDVELTACDARVFVTQAAGEYAEKLEKNGLTLVTRHPEEELRIRADGRRMWRVFDNLMNNICKYAQSGTRVYLTLEQSDGYAVFSFKNTSREALDMSEEELMERFTRGDSSRNTEGNGLGLSIARSMAELQGGTLHVSIDGDLFKAVLRFPVMSE